MLNLGTGAASWWEVNGIGCKPYFSVNGSLATPLHINVQLADIIRPPRPDWVDGCLLNYYYVEVIHAAVQLILAVFISNFLILKKRFHLTVFYLFLAYCIAERCAHSTKICN